jgi:hypothetical protein
MSFAFSNRKEALNWNTIHTTNLEQIIGTTDIESLESAL